MFRVGEKLDHSEKFVTSVYDDREAFLYEHDMSLFVGCHLKFHKHHYDNSEEFVGYCKGETFCDL